MIATSPANAPATVRGVADRWFIWLLASIAAVALVIRVHVGSLEFMDYDEWQQVFMASAPRWKDLAYEVTTQAHPPAFYLLLKALLMLGHSKLLYRCIAIVPGTGSVVLIGLIARKLLRSPAMALLCATGLALSTAAIAVSIEVRQYQLTVFLLLIAFDAFLTIWTDGASVGSRPYVIYAVSSMLAVLCHYSAIVFLGGCTCLAVTRQMFDRGWVRSQRWHLATSLGLPVALFAYLYLTHARRLPMLGYLYDFYWGLKPGETLIGFLTRTFQNFWNLFAIVESPDRTIALSLALVLGLLSAVILLLTRRPGDRSILPILLAGVMVIELAGMAIARVYPFGGLLRHQYVVGPFLILSAFVVIDRLASLPGPRTRGVLTASTAFLLIGNLIARWPTLVAYPNVVVYTEQFNRYRAAFPDARAVYVPSWNVIGYYIHTNDRPRHFVRRIDDVFVIDQYHIAGPPDGGVEIFYDKSRSVIDVRLASFYRSLARCLKQSGAKELTVFFFTPGDVPLKDDPETLRQIITQTAIEEGLTATKVLVGPTTIFAGFELRQ